MEATRPGRIIILNGAPRAGKSSIAAAIMDIPEDDWLNLGVDIFMQATPARLRPGIGLRPGGERPDLEPFVAKSYRAMYESIAAHSRLALNVVTDVGHHDSYSTPLGILGACARILAGLPVLFVGVRCPIEVIMERRNLGQPGREGLYERGSPGDPVPDAVRRWEPAVHNPGIYDLEVDTSLRSPVECAEVILARLRDGPPGTAFERLAAG